MKEPKIYYEKRGVRMKMDTRKSAKTSFAS